MKSLGFQDGAGRLQFMTDPAPRLFSGRGAFTRVVRRDRKGVWVDRSTLVVVCGIFFWGRQTKLPGDRDENKGGVDVHTFTSVAGSISYMCCRVGMAP